MTLTLSNEHLDTANKDLHRFLDFLSKRLKRAGGRLHYVWVVELQKKRYVRYGVKALHWHFAVIAPEGALPNVSFNQSAPRWHKYQVVEDGAVVKYRDLVERWGRGQVFSMCAWSASVYGYLGKYFGKDAENIRGYDARWNDLRRWGASQLGFYRFPQWAFDAVREVAEIDEGALDLAIRKEGGRVNFYGFEKVTWPGGTEIVRRVRVYSVRSPWRRLGGDGLTSPARDSWRSVIAVGENNT